MIFDNAMFFNSKGAAKNPFSVRELLNCPSTNEGFGLILTSSILKIEIELNGCKFITYLERTE